MITSNHAHLLIKDNGDDVIAQSMQLIAGRTAQEYNQRKEHHGAFWEDRYHATAIDTDEHLHRGIVYIDLNMVRAGVVNHPAQWLHSGYREIQKPTQAIRGNRPTTADSHYAVLPNQKSFNEPITNGSKTRLRRELARAPHWSEAIAVGRSTFVEKVKNELGAKAMHREVVQADGTYALREPAEAYARNFTRENEALSSENTLPCGMKASKTQLDSVVRPAKQDSDYHTREPGSNGTLSTLNSFAIASEYTNRWTIKHQCSTTR